MIAASLFHVLSNLRPMRAILTIAVLAVLACGKTIDGPVAGGVTRSASNATLNVRATFDNPSTSSTDFDTPVAARVIVYGADPANPSALTEIVNVVQAVDPTASPDSGAMLLTVNVPQSSLSLVRAVVVKTVNATGDTTYKAGPTPVTAGPNGRDSVKVETPATYVGPGSNAARVAITPKTATIGSGDAFLFTATAYAADKSPLDKVVLKWSTLDPDLVKLDNSRDGLVLSRGVAGTARVVVAVDGATAADTATLVISAGSRSITLVSGDAQSAIVRTTLAKPIVVRVLGVDGKPQVGATVSFNVLSGKTTSTPVRVPTDSLGLAQISWTLGGDAGAQQMSAELVGARAYVLVNATALKYTLSYVSGADQSAAPGAALAKPIVVQLLNGSAPVVGGTVHFTAKLGGGSVKDSLVSTDSTGKAQTTWTIGNGTAGQQLMATADGASEPVYAGANANTITGTENAGAASASIVSGDRQTALLGTELGSPIVVRVLKADGKPAVGATVQFSPSAGTLSNTAAVADSNGLAQTRWSMGTAPGAVTLRVDVPGGKIATLTVNATAWTYVLSLVSGNNQSGPASALLGTPIVLKVTGLDKPIRGETITVAITGGGSVSPTTLTTDSLGLVSLKWTLGAGGTQQLLATTPRAIARVTVDAKIPDVVLPSMTIFSLSPAVVGPGGTLTVSVRVTNQNGVAIGSVPVTLTSDVATDSIVGQTGTTDANGIARFGMLARASGTHTLTATMTAPAQAKATTTLLVVTPATIAVHLVKVSGDSQTVKRGTGAEAPFVVQALDRAGKPVAGAFVDFGGDNGENRRVTNANGVASFTRTTTTDWPKGVFTIPVKLSYVADTTVNFTLTVTP